MENENKKANISFWDKLDRFMEGRHNTDNLSRLNFILFAVLDLISDFFMISWVLKIIAWLLFAVWVFRFISKDEKRRSRENEIYCSLVQKLRRKIRELKDKIASGKKGKSEKAPEPGKKPGVPPIRKNSEPDDDLDDFDIDDDGKSGGDERPAPPAPEATGYLYFRCPECDTELKIPGRSGTFSVRCPRCSASFNVHGADN